MSKKGYISRYLLIIKRLKSKPYTTLDDLQSYVEKQFEHLQMVDEDLGIGSSTRTLQRDMKEIKNLFGIDIEYSKSHKGYFISQSEMENMNFERMIESVDIFNSLNFAHDLKPFIHLEKHRPQETENLYGLLHAIKKHLQIEFSYHKFWDDEYSFRVVEPYALKEFKNRLYIIGRDINDKVIKSFALDRLYDFDITDKLFVKNELFNIEEYYRYCFGIISPNGKEPQEIILSFNPNQGKYIKSLPLHNTQQILIDNDEELQVKLKLCISFDFVMELLSFADSMEVIKPKSLAIEIKSAHERAAKLYDKD